MFLDQFSIDNGQTLSIYIVSQQIRQRLLHWARCSAWRQRVFALEAINYVETNELYWRMLRDILVHFKARPDLFFPFHQSKKICDGSVELLKRVVPLPRLNRIIFLPFLTVSCSIFSVDTQPSHFPDCITKALISCQYTYLSDIDIHSQFFIQ